MTTFVMTDTTAGAQGQRFDKAAEAYRKARESEAGGRKAVIKLPNGEEVSTPGVRTTLPAQGRRLTIAGGSACRA